jgi:hypothetical protein
VHRYTSVQPPHVLTGALSAVIQGLATTDHSVVGPVHVEFS